MAVAKNVKIAGRSERFWLRKECVKKQYVDMEKGLAISVTHKGF